MSSRFRTSGTPISGRGRRWHLGPPVDGRNGNARSKLLRLTILLAVLVCHVAGCKQLQAALLPPSKSCEGGEWKEGPNGEMVREWKLSDGRISSIRSRARGFYNLRPTGWQQPTTFIGTEQAGKERTQLANSNAARIKALEKAIQGSAGIKLRQVQDADLDLYEIEVEGAQPKPRIRIWNPDTNQTSFLVTWDGCKQLTAVDTCEAGELRTKLTLSGSGTCVPVVPGGPDLLASLGVGPSVKLDHATVRTVSNQDLRGSGPPDPKVVGALKDLGITQVPKGSMPIALLSADGGQVLAGVLVMKDDFSDATPNEIIALLEAGDLVAATKAAKTLSAPPDSAERGKIVAAQVKATRDAIADTKPPGVPVFILKYTPFAEGSLPGDDKIAPLLVEHMVRALDVAKDQQDEPATTLRRQLALIMLAERWLKEPNDGIRQHRERIEKEYGPRVASGEIGGQKVVDIYGQIFPGSEHVMAAYARIREEAAQKRREAEQRDKERKVDNAWASLKWTVDEVARYRHMARFGAQYAEMTWNPPQARRAAVAVQAEAARKLKDDFCPAKKSFIAVAGAEEFSSRARDLCANDPPTAQTPQGEVALTADCTSIAATACQ